jgi:hypothetical protein
MQSGLDCQRRYGKPGRNVSVVAFSLILFCLLQILSTFQFEINQNGSVFSLFSATFDQPPAFRLSAQPQQLCRDESAVIQSLKNHSIYDN